MEIKKYNTVEGFNNLDNLGILNLVVLQKYYIGLLEDTYKKDNNVILLKKANLKLRKLIGQLYEKK